MDDQPNNSGDEVEQWVNFAAYDEPGDAPESNGGGCGSTGEPRRAWIFIPETESKCIPISIAGERYELLGDRWKHMLTATITCRCIHDRW